MQNQTNKREKLTIQFSVTFSESTALIINEMMELPEYRNNRSFLIESLVTTNREYLSYLKKQC